MLIWICLAACTIASTKDSSSAFSHGCYSYSCWLAQDHTSLRHVWRMNDSSFRRFGAPFLTITKFLSKETGRQVDRQGDSRFKVGVFSEKMQLGLPLKSSQTTTLGSCERIMLGRKLVFVVEISHPALDGSHRSAYYTSRQTDWVNWKANEAEERNMNFTSRMSPKESGEAHQRMKIRNVAFWSHELPLSSISTAAPNFLRVSGRIESKQ